MEASPARLYASAVGALLLIVGVLGFFYSASFGSPGEVETALGALHVNAWLNLFHVALGALGLLLAGLAPRRYALATGGLLTVVGVWGLALGPGAAILGFLPVNGGDDALHLALGLLGLAAAAGTPKPARHEGGKREPKLEPRAQAAAERA